jgi:hypothetical protein
MDLSTVALPPVSEKPATLFVALELSKATWLVALHSPAADKVSLVLLRKNGERLMKQEDLHAQVTEALYARIPG